MDSDYQTDKGWLLNVQMKLYRWSKENSNQQYRDLWNWITDIRNLRCAWQVVSTNKGKRTAGIDGITVGTIKQRIGIKNYLDEIRDEVRTGKFKPSPCRRKWIPKAGKPGKFRPLGIPTVKDRIIQAAVKQIIEPIFEAQFWHVSYGFRPGRSCLGALEHIRMTIRPKAVNEYGIRHKMPYQWVIEGDIKGCFDNIDHHKLMNEVRKRITDRKVNKLIVKFLKAGILEKEQFYPTQIGTPQGGIISPLLANISLSIIEQKYERWVNKPKDKPNRKSNGITAALGARMTDRKAGRPVFFPIRYADDFLIISSGNREEIENEKEELSKYIKARTGLELSNEKTKITSWKEGCEFLGQYIKVRYDERYGYTPRIVIPKSKINHLRYKIKQLTKGSRTYLPLQKLLKEINSLTRGWSNYFRFCTGAKSVLSSLDWYVTDRIWRWMKKKYPKATVKVILKNKIQSKKHPTYKVWAQSGIEQFLMSKQKVERFKRGWMRKPEYSIIPGEPCV